MSLAFLLLFAFKPVLRAQSGTTPILLIVNSAYAPNPFGNYLGEILRAEGLNAFDVIDLGAVTANDLAAHDVTILAETTLTGAQATLFSDHVGNGGRLIAMRPDAQIKGLFRLGAASGTLNNGYLKMDPTVTVGDSQPAKGLSDVTLQIHGAADQYAKLNGAIEIARLYSNANNATSYPAVLGNSSGRAIAFTYDLARNVAYTRQGNPANANLDVDGDGDLRTTDLFQAQGGGAPWVNRDRISIPQADEQQRLFARLVKQMVGLARPMPQLWYFPGTAKTVLILTADAHANPTSSYQFEIDSVNAHNGKMTFYLSIGADPSDTSVQGWRAQGHDFGMHPYAFWPDPYPPYNITNLSQGFDVYTNWFSSTFTSPKSRTVRTHKFAWEGWTTAADYAASHGIAMDLNYAHWGPWFQKNNGTWPHGYFTGSGRPMKFVRSDGTLIPVYQQLTPLVDEHLLAGMPDEVAQEKLKASEALEISQQLIDASQAGQYTALVMALTVDYYGAGRAKPWAEGTMDYASGKGIPIWNAERWLSFTETRHDANYSNAAWNASTRTLTFALASTATPNVNLTTLLPSTYNGLDLASVSVDGASTPFSIQKVNGINQAFVAMTAGNHNVSAVYSGPTPTPTKTPTRTQTPTPMPTATFTPPAGCASVPDAPNPLKPPEAATLGKVKVKLSWDEPLCAQWYNVVVHVKKKTGKVVDSAERLVSSYKTKSLTKGKKYFWEVQACNGNGCGAFSVPRKFWIAP